MPSPPFLRKRRGLLWFWVIGLATAALTFWITRKIPALQELLRPVYWVIVLALAVFTLRWFRPRKGDRRQGDRRHPQRRKDDTDRGYQPE